MTRACENWLTTYRDWTLPRSEAPESYIFWTGIFSLASVLKRRVSVGHNLLGSWNAYPNFYILFISPPATARKTTTVGYADDLLENIPGVTVAASAPSVQVLHKRITETKDCSISIRSPEFATFINTSGFSMVDYLTDLYDGKKHHSSDTLARSLEFAERPCVNLLGATVPVWIAENLGEQMVGGGFTSRVIFIYEQTVRRRKLLYKDVDMARIEQLKESLVSDLTHLAINIEGEFQFESEETEKWIEEWYQTNAPKWEKEDRRLGGYYERKHAHAIKLAMLLHLAYSDELVLTKQDLESAIILLSQIEPKMIKVFQAVGKNPHASEMDVMLSYFEAKGEFTKKDFFSRFYHDAPPAVLQDMLNAFITMGVITTNGSDPTNIKFRWISGKRSSRQASPPQYVTKPGVESEPEDR